MVVKVKHDELNEVSKVINKDSEAYDVEINNMLQAIEKLRGIWQGEDSETFCNNATEYITKMKNITRTMRNMTRVIDTANVGYEECDEAFGNALEAEAMNYDE